MSIAIPIPIGLCGRPGAGKNATADVLTSIYGYRQTSFAEALRMEVASITIGRCRIPHEIVCDPDLSELAVLLLECRGMDPWIKPTPPKLRRVLQLYGSEFRRKQDPDYWVKQVEVHNATVVTDVRFPNEIARVREFGGQLWWVHRTYLPEEVIPHQSEALNCDTADRVVWNDGTLEDLKMQVMDAMRCLKGAIREAA